MRPAEHSPTGLSLRPAHDGGRRKRTVMAYKFNSLGCSLCGLVGGAAFECPKSSLDGWLRYPVASAIAAQPGP